MKRLFTCLVMMSALPMMAFAQVWNGEGTEDNPYQITSDEEMQAFAYSVNSGNDYSGVYFSLSEDVTTGPIATDGNIFSGVFDGNGHTVSVSIHSGYRDVGLFGRIENATIRELKVAGSLSSLGDMTDGGSGALVGYAKNSTITDCHNSANIDCAYKCNGGICGYSEGSTIQYCTNSGDVRAMLDNQDRTGGICGLNYGGTITNCSNSGHITGDDGVGGIVGRNEEGGTTKSCINSGVVEGDLYVGGIVGEVYSLTPLRSAQEAQVAYCYNEGGVVGNEYVAGIEQAKIYAQEGGVYVQTAQPTEVIIISMNGTIIKRETQIGAKHYELSRGIYVICINEQRYKVRI